MDLDTRDSQHWDYWCEDGDQQSRSRMQCCKAWEDSWVPEGVVLPLEVGKPGVRVLHLLQCYLEPYIFDLLLHGHHYGPPAHVMAPFV